MLKLKYFFQKFLSFKSKFSNISPNLTISTPKNLSCINPNLLYNNYDLNIMYQNVHRLYTKLHEVHSNFFHLNTTFLFSQRHDYYLIYNKDKNIELEFTGFIVFRWKIFCPTRIQ